MKIFDPEHEVPRVEILGTKRKTIKSSVAGENYDLYINFPRSYWDSEKRSHYPVLYVLNGQWDFPVMTASYGNQNYDGLIPEIIIVGIAWSGGENVTLDFQNLGLRDFTPTKAEGLTSGGAAQFLRVISDEIIPYMESTYPVTDDRGLAGGSVSGLFVLYAMLTSPSVFRRYITSSPTIHWDDSFILKYESLFARENNLLTAALSISWGEYEDHRFIRQFIANLKSRNYGGLTLETIEISGTGHAGNKPEGFTRGLLSVYRRPELVLTESEMSVYTGFFLLEDNRRIEIKCDHHRLFLRWEFNNTITPVFVERPGKLFIKGTYLFLHFHEDEHKPLTFEFWDKLILARRTNE